VPTTERVFVALGSNLGDREAHLRRARARLASLPGTRLVAATSAEETAPLGPIPQGPYLNQMVLLETALQPRELLEHCLAIERESGRIRGRRWGPRTLDLDIVRMEAQQVDEPGLTVPHPELPNREFWQRELAALDAHLSGCVRRP
jgi:2-amino-4-hydroxy-6-hydroxymethyldihydropteridine diphosphokinase